MTDWDFESHYISRFSRLKCDDIASIVIFIEGRGGSNQVEPIPHVPYAAEGRAVLDGSHWTTPKRRSSLVRCWFACERASERASEHVGGYGSKKRRHITRVTSDVSNAVTLHTRKDQSGPRFECFSARCHAPLFTG